MKLNKKNDKPPTPLRFLATQITVLEDALLRTRVRLENAGWTNGSGEEIIEDIANALAFTGREPRS